ncbi:LOW QUALITY PROTEIN: hypothetical protein CVT25_010758 [Psilocybe cyanescens]|uniref:Glycoside hydrolase 131 catalytic N-terminal domain-containing protein n=1 Tax=Psilocybe cyanescens TaxID=93625 RepID=A0A409WJS1_PSICY|nr:LOW QUALITY PROTEIN: hypothetical protein CVT25_010758 [Psilocybe cyanescens]
MSLGFNLALRTDTNPTGKLPAKNARNFKVLDHALNILFSAPFIPISWHNFAVQVDCDSNTVAVLYSQDSNQLKASDAESDTSDWASRLPFVNPADSPADQGNIVLHGMQEGATEGLLYFGLFVEGVQNRIGVGGGRTIKTV